MYSSRAVLFVLDGPHLDRLLNGVVPYAWTVLCAIAWSVVSGYSSVSPWFVSRVLLSVVCQRFACSLSLSLRAKLSNSWIWRCRLGLVSVGTYVSPSSSTCTVSSVCDSVA